MSFLDIKLQFRPLIPGTYWSKTRNEMMYMKDNSFIVWETEDLPVKMELITMKEILEYTDNHRNLDKTARPLIMRFYSERFPLKELVGMDKWNGVIAVDLDLQHDAEINNYDSNKRTHLYIGLINALRSICPDNFAYIEHSSSGIGIHIWFYFNCEKLKENFDKYAYFVYDVFKNKIDEYIEDFSHIFDSKGVFDPVYARPYQKVFLTGIDAMAYDCSGDCSNIDIEVPVYNSVSEPEINERAEFKVESIKIRKEYEAHYQDRFYIITALKKYIGDKEEARKIWYQLCDHFTLYDNHTTREFKNQLDNMWDKVKAETGKIQVLKKYGININTNNLHIYLNDNEYLGDVSSTILSSLSNGINLVIAAPGVGKTELWKSLAEEWSNPMNLWQHKPILVIEPMNSIVSNKYDNETFLKAIGSKKIKSDNGISAVVTNYNHCINKKENEFLPLENPDKFFEPFELVVVDESHILMKDKFRSDVLIPFMETLNRCKNTKIVIQTGTPMFEQSTLQIKKTIEVHKQSKQNVKVIWREVQEDKFNIAQLICITKYYVTNGRKTYIYWNNAPLNQLKFLQNMCEDHVMIYHKRASGDDDMNTIENEHKLGKYNIFSSSVYFGVGNDLNDEIEKAAVIIVGNNPWQEDVQALGRWRNAKDIEMCIIIRPEEKEEYEKTIDNPASFSRLMKRYVWKYEQEWNDFRNREKSIIIRGASWAIKDKWYIDYLAKIGASSDYSVQTKVKIEEFEKRGYDVRKTIKPLETNKEWEEELRKHKKDIADIRNKEIASMISGEFDWDSINKDPKTETCARIIKKLIDNDLLKYCDLDKFVYSKIIRYKTFLRYYLKRKLDDDDLAELFSLVWTINKLKDLRKDKKEESLDSIVVDNKEILMSAKEHVCLLGYIVWLRWRDNKEFKEQTQFNYYKEFEKKVDDLSNIEGRLLNRIFVKFGVSSEYIKFEAEFLKSEEHIDKDRVVETESDFMKYIEAVDEASNMYKQIKGVVEIINARLTKGKIGGKIGSPKKECIITDKFKKPEKYGLHIGDKFISCDELCKKTNKSPKTISQWRSKGWLE